MNYWLTTHWPHPIVNERDDHAWHVYLRENRRILGEEIRERNIILFYQTEEFKINGRIQRTIHPIGSPQDIDLDRPGYKAIRGATRVSREIQTMQASGFTLRYDYGFPNNWNHIVMCDGFEEVEASRRVLFTPMQDILGITIARSEFALRRIENNQRLQGFLRRIGLNRFAG